MNIKQGLFIGFIVAFFILGFVSMERSMPEAKEDRIYKAIKVYSPYQLEKRMGGLTIVDTRDGTKEKPSAAEVLFRMDELDKKWGKEHLRVEGNDVFVIGDNNQTVTKIFIETQKERDWLHKFFGI